MRLWTGIGACWRAARSRWQVAGGRLMARWVQRPLWLLMKFICG